MYIPEHFRETKPQALAALIQRHSLGMLVAQTDEGPTVHHIPMQLAQDADRPVLRGHVARANPLWQQLKAGSSVLVVFRGAEHYISPAWYPSKEPHGRVVPTWNYAAVHVTGQIRFTQDRSWLHTLVESLTDAHEPATADRLAVAAALKSLGVAEAAVAELVRNPAS